VRILVAHNVSRARSGGMSRIMGFIHDEIAAAGHEVDWLCAEDLAPRWRGAAARVAFPWLVHAKARRAARDGEPYDLVNVHEPQGAVVTSMPGAVRHGVVVTSHGIEERAWQLALEEGRLGRGGPGLKSRLVYPPTGLTQSRVALTRARFVFTLNDTDRRYAIEHLGVPADRVGRMVPGATRDYEAAAKGRSYASGSGIVFAGTWRKNKGIDDFVPAFTTFARRWPDVTLTAIGTGVDPSVVKSAFPDDLRHRVLATKAVDDVESARALAEANVFVLPSLFEGTPLTLIEAMMSGLPIVTTDTCGMHDVIRHDVTGLLVPVRSPHAISAALDRLMSAADLRERLGRAAQADAVTNYTWPRVAAQVLDVYQQLVA
jgi:glycosyltransferase involved in cell wall biosynthesis